MSGIIGGAGSKSGVIGQTEEKVGMVHLATVNNLESAGSGDIPLDGFFTTEFDHYKYMFSINPFTNMKSVAMRVNHGGSATSTGLYASAQHMTYLDENQSEGHGVDDSLWDETYVRISSTNNAESGQNPAMGELLLSNPLDDGCRKPIVGHSVGYNNQDPSNAIRLWNFGCFYDTNAVLTGVTFCEGVSGGGVWGSVSLYGLRTTSPKEYV